VIMVTYRQKGIITATVAAEAAEATAVVDEAVSLIVMTNTLPFPTSVTVTRPIAPATSSVARPTVGKAGRGAAAVAVMLALGPRRGAAVGEAAPSRTRMQWPG